MTLRILQAEVINKNYFFMSYKGLYLILHSTENQKYPSAYTNVCFNIYLSFDIFPKVFKKALVHPIYKKGNSGSVDNYRPISVLSILFTFFEKNLNKTLQNFLKQFNILSLNQYGFKSHKSTNDAILDFTMTIIGNLDNKLKTMCIFLGLSKAFDTVSVSFLHLCSVNYVT